MKTIIALLGIILLVSATSNQQTLFTQISQQPFGKALINLVQLNTPTNGATNELELLLSDIKSELLAASSLAETQWTLKNQDCTDSIQGYTNSLDTQQSDIKQYQNQLSNLKQTLNDYQNELEKQQQELETSQTNLENLKNELTEKQTSYETSNVDYTEAIEACTSAINLLSTVKTSESTGSFIQKNTIALVQSQSKSLQKAINVLQKKLGSNSKTLLYTPIIELLSTLTTSIDQKQLSRCIDLIGNLRQSLIDAQYSTTNSFTEIQTKLQDSIKLTETDILNLQQNINELKSKISTTEDDITTTEGLISSSQSLFESTTELLKNIKSDCTDAENYYNSDKKRRQSELAILEQLIDHFSKNIKDSSALNDD